MGETMAMATDVQPIIAELPQPEEVHHRYLEIRRSPLARLRRRPRLVGGAGGVPSPQRLLATAARSKA
jgi:hypothetical protein